MIKTSHIGDWHMDVHQFSKKFFLDVDHNSYEDLFELLPDIFYFVKNKNYQFVAVNDNLMKHFLFTDKSEIIGKTDYDILSFDQAEHFRADDQKIINSGSVFKDVVELVGDGAGNVSWYITSKMPIRNNKGEIVGLQGITRDVDKSKNTIVPYHILKDVIVKIQKEYMNNLTVDDLAKETKMSVSTFERKFKKYFKMTPIKYIKQLRIEQACKQLLDLNISLSDVAQNVGFCDQSYFTKEFKKIMKMTPRHYREKIIPE